MRLLWDHNLSHRLIAHLEDVFPGGLHVRDAGLEAASDDEVWHYARDYGLDLVSKDSDFQELVSLRGAPPKLIWLRLGNCTTSEVEALVRSARDLIDAFANSPDEDVLVLS